MGLTFLVLVLLTNMLIRTAFVYLLYEDFGLPCVYGQTIVLKTKGIAGSCAVAEDFPIA